MTTLQQQQFVARLRSREVEPAEFDQVVWNFVGQSGFGSGPDIAFLVDAFDATPLIRSTIRRVLFDESDVEDALQESLLAIAASITSFEARSSVSTWAAAIARNKAVDVLRRRRSTPLPPDDIARHVSEVERFSSQWATRSDLENALSVLSPKLRSVFELGENQGLPYDQIAEQLGIPRNTVASRLRRARAQLKMVMVAEVGDRG